MSWQDRYNKTDTFADRLMRKFVNCYSAYGGIRVEFDVNEQKYGLAITNDLIQARDEETIMDTIYKQIMYKIQCHYHQEFIDGASDRNNIVVSTQATPGRVLQIMHPEDYHEYLRNGGR